jgi:hypothetical protein
MARDMSVRCHENIQKHRICQILRQFHRLGRDFVEVLTRRWTERYRLPGGI